MSQRKQTFTKTNAINIIFTSQVSPILQNVHAENFQCLLEYVIMRQNTNMVQYFSLVSEKSQKETNSIPS